ncbi:MAG: SHOCT domain-containing protein [Pleurocapsa sp.]
MASHYFIANNIDLNTVYQKLLLWFKTRQYEVDGVENQGEYLIQARKTGLIRTFTGTNMAFKVRIYWSKNSDRHDEFVVETATGKWISNIAGAGFASMFTGGFTVLTGLAGAGWIIVVENSLIEYITNALDCSRIKPEIELEIERERATNQPIDITSEPHLSAREKAEAKAKIELQKLETAYREGILDRSEFNTKKSEIEVAIDRYEIDFTIENQMKKLEKAFIDGILNEQEYEAKVARVCHNVETEILNRRLKVKKQKYLEQLKQAWEQGVLSQAEYETKVADLERE